MNLRCCAIPCFDAEWLGSWMSICPIKNLNGEVLAWLSVWSEVQMICIWFRWCHYQPSSLALLQESL